MGMFDWINYEAPCPRCGKKVTGWQSKNGNCELNTLEPYEVEFFYSMCDSCKTWIDIQVERSLTVVVNKVVLYPSWRAAGVTEEKTALEPIDLTDRYRGERGKVINSGP